MLNMPQSIEEILYITEVHSEHSQTSKMEFFAEIVNGSKQKFPS